MSSPCECCSEKEYCTRKECDRWKMWFVIKWRAIRKSAEQAIKAKRGKERSEK